MVVTIYSNVFLFVLSFLAILLSNDYSFGFMSDLSFTTWTLFLVASLLSISEHTTKFVALKFQEASKLQKFIFLPNLW